MWDLRVRRPTSSPSCIRSTGRCHDQQRIRHKSFLPNLFEQQSPPVKTLTGPRSVIRCESTCSFLAIVINRILISTQTRKRLCLSSNSAGSGVAASHRSKFTFYSSFISIVRLTFTRWNMPLERAYNYRVTTESLKRYKNIFFFLN